MLEIKNLNKNFGVKSAVCNVSLEIKSGEVLSLIGPNGSGKTTIVKVVSGLLRASSGMVKVGDYDISREPLKAKALIGYVPDEPAVWPVMTGEEFLHFTGALYGIDEETRRKRIAGSLSIFNLEQVEKQYFEDYSRGNKQKFSILAAMLHQPKLLLIDEPIVGLDPVSAEVVKQKIKEYASHGGAVLLVTHTLNVAQEIATKIGILYKGRLVAAGTFSELCAQAALSEKSSLEDVYMWFCREHG